MIAPEQTLTATGRIYHNEIKFSIELSQLRRIVAGNGVVCKAPAKQVFGQNRNPCFNELIAHQMKAARQRAKQQSTLSARSCTYIQRCTLIVERQMLNNVAKKHT